ncbi:virulence factor SrfB [Scandinavium lactucae]|uniref:Virulence factor SrfB n=1 Tax=Scandinavium lactucae TaxID=3095028 RepID=A0ABU4QSS9_9ENTR|nr:MULTISPECIES: virulence factor SrfB [unclassified Scandinavium]MDX6042328.1 virulence factor SrfB [Scandinavium sp. V105_6]MDX6052329.1 virulence factor SrfB [Scandinavium sp. V105_1]
MLVTLCDYQQSVTLIANSGVQFLDFGLTPQDSLSNGRFVRKTANGPLLRLNYDIVNCRYTLPPIDGQQAEVVKPESTLPLEQSLAVLDGVWLPLPFLRFNPPRTFVEGPDNWARVQIRKLPEPDSAGNTHRVTIALDSQIRDDAPMGLAPVDNDLLNGTRFALAWRDEEVADFLDQTWIDGWLREVFSHYACVEENRSEREIAQAMRGFEYQGHWLNLLALLGEQLKVPEVKIVTATVSTPAIPVDLILDVGNSHTCGVIIEDHGDANDGLRQTAELQVRSLSEPQFLNAPLFTSRLEFSEARFGKQHFSVESGREDAFIWPSIVRVGDEARKLAMQRLGTEGNSGISSPRRYLWDETPTVQDWRFSQMNSRTQREPVAAAFPLAYLMNDDGQPLFTLPQDERMPVFSPQYSRSTLMTHMLCEILAQALGQINSVATRQRLGFPSSPRQLRTLILTLPSAMPKQEREIFRRRMFEAIALVWKALGWHPQDDDFATQKQQDKSVVPVPKIHMEWDEASCGQLVWLYNEAMSHFGGQTEAFFAALARPDRQAEPGTRPGRALRVAAVDLGGGTTDMAITHYRLDEGTGSNVKISPQLLFREGFKVAGDDILLDIIQRCVLPALQNQLQKSGIADAPALMATLFGDSGRIDTQAVLRQQTTLQLFMPIGHAILGAWEQSDINDPLAGLHATFGELLPQVPTRNVMNYVGQAIGHALPPGSEPFDVLATPLQVSFRSLHEAMLAGEFTIAAPLHAVCEAISHYACDVLLVTGRPGCLPGVQALIRYLQPVPVNRMVWMDSYHVHEWYPFSQQGRIGNPKSTAAVGAMLCSLALDLRLPRFNFKAADIGAYSTVRYLGVLDNTVNTLREENIWYAELDLDKPGAKVDARLHFPLRGNVTLGFRQLANARWPATPLYTLSINSPEVAKAIAGDGVLQVRLQLSGGNRSQGPEAFTLADAWLQDGTPVPPDALTLKLNTLADRRHSGSHYWIDSGSVYLK